MGSGAALSLAERWLEAGPVTHARISRDPPPRALEVVLRVRALVQQARAFLLTDADWFSRARARARDALLQELAQLSACVLAGWAPGVDLDEVVRRLREEPPDLFAHDLTPRPHGELGLAPLSLEEIVLRGRVALASPALAHARELYAREAHDVMRLQAEMVQATRRRRHAAMALEGRLRRETEEALEACEVLEQGMEEAISAAPPLGIAMAAHTAAAALLGQLFPHELVLGLQGELLNVPSFCRRAVVLAAFSRLQHRTKSTFPDLWQLLAGARAPALHATARARSPFRIGAAGDPGGVANDDDLGRAMRWLESAGTRALFERALDHIAMAGATQRALEPTRRRVRFFDRLAFWSSSQAEQHVDALRRRHGFHLARAAVIAQQLERSVEPLSSQLPILRLRDSMLRASRVLHLAPTSPDAGQPNAVQTEVMAALAGVKAELCHHSWQHAPATGALLEQLQAVAWHAHAIRAAHHSAKNGKISFQVVRGIEHARIAFAGWSHAVLQALGEMPPNGLLLFHFIERELDP